MLLYAGERAIASDRVEAVVGGQIQAGNLHLTNVRLVFEGMFLEPRVGWVPRTLLDLHLGHITNAAAFPGKDKRHTLRVEAGVSYVYTFLTPIAPHWAQAIVDAKRSAPPLTPASPAPGGPPVVVNVQSTPGTPSVFLHCRHCGSLSAAGSVHCTSCGATL